MAQLPTETVTLLFTDIEGSTRLLERLGDRYLEVLHQHRRLLRAAFAQFDGREVGTQGDAFLVAFATASGAVAAAVEGQRALATHPWSDGVALQVRMGIHTGEPIADADDYAGLDVHRAARICAAGHGGQVLLSQATREALGVELPPGVRLLDLGEHRLKDLTGSQRLVQLVIPGLAAEFPALRTLGPRPTNLPVQLSGFVGREQELARLHELLDDAACRLVTIVGPGGIGKTRLAVQVATTRQDRHQDGVVFVPLAGTTPARPEKAGDLIIANLARALGVSLAVPRDPLELLADHLAARQLLVVLDSLEQLQHAAEVVAKLLQRAPRVQVLMTSRRRLGLNGERLVEVAGLPYPAADAADHCDYAAVQLFEDRACLIRSGFRSAADEEDVARICRLVAGVPLAIELAARWIRTATPAVIAERLASGLDLLVTSAPDVERRHQSLRSVIDWSWQLLTDDEQRVLARLSVFRGGFTLDAAGVVAGATLPLLAALVDHSLVSAAEDDRYITHELLRQYAAEQLAGDPADDQATRERHARHYAALLPDPAQAGASNERGLDAEVENLRSATDWLVEHADPTRLDVHLVRLMPFYGRKGWFREAQAVLTAALEDAGVPTVQRARWHRLLGEAYLQLGEVGPARQHFERTLALLGSSPPVSTPGWLDMLASQALHRQLRQLRPYGVVERGEEQRFRAAERAAVCWQMVEACWVLEDWAALLPLSLFGLNQAERAGRLDLAARNQIIVGMVAGIAGLHRLARRHVQAAVSATDRAGDPVTICWTQLVGGLHWGGVGDWEALEARLGQALSAAAGARLHRLADQVLLTGAICRYLTGRFVEAAAMAADVRASGRERRDPSVHLWGLVALMESRLRLDPGDPAIAGWIEEADQLLGNVARIDAARVHVATARFHLAAGRTADTWHAARAAADLAGSEPSFVQYTLEAHAGIPEVCLALLERGEPTGVDSAELRATAAAGLRRLRRYARSIPMAEPRALACFGRWYWLKDQHGAARRAWARAVRAAEGLAMPWELASAHYELGRHLGVDARSPLGLDRTDHLDKARSTFETLGCRTEPITPAGTGAVGGRPPRGGEGL